MQSVSLKLIIWETGSHPNLSVQYSVRSVWMMRTSHTIQAQNWWRTLLWLLLCHRTRMVSSSSCKDRTQQPLLKPSLYWHSRFQSASPRALHYNYSSLSCLSIKTYYQLCSASHLCSNRYHAHSCRLEISSLIIMVFSLKSSALVVSCTALKTTNLCWECKGSKIDITPRAPLQTSCSSGLLQLTNMR
jgi:hypothetical protein